MCIEIIERYASCKCIYYRHAVDPCPRYGKRGHQVTVTEVKVGHQCPEHSSSSIQKGDRLRPRRGQAFDHIPHAPRTLELTSDFPLKHGTEADRAINDDGGFASMLESENRSLRPAWADDDLDILYEQAAREQPNIDLIPFKNVKQQIEHFTERGFYKGSQVQHIHYSLQPGRGARPTRPRIDPRPKSSNDDELHDQSIALQPLASCEDESTLESALTLEVTNQGTSTHERSNPASTSVTGTLRRRIRPCHSLIALGALTIISSLSFALWRTISSHDMSGGFSLAQYILGVGVFVVGSVTVIHSRNCRCWNT